MPFGTNIADIIVPEIWLPYMIERTAAKSRFVTSGVMVPNPQFDQIAAGAGTQVNIPNFIDLTGESEVLSDSNSLNLGRIGTTQQVGVKHYRGKAWGSNDLAKALAGEDPLKAIADLVAAWWARDMQRTLISTLKGIFASTTMSPLKLDRASADGVNATNQNFLNAINAIDAFGLLGDSSSSIAAIAMHSVTYHNLLKQNLITFVPTSEQGDPIAQYLGKDIIVDDSLPVVPGATSGSVYTSWFFGRGSVAYGEAQPEEAVETGRDKLRGTNYLINRRHFICHPNGLKWIGTNAGVSPTNTELENANAWTRVFEVKNVPVVQLLTNG